MKQFEVEFTFQVIQSMVATVPANTKEEAVEKLTEAAGPSVTEFTVVGVTELPPEMYRIMPDLAEEVLESEGFEGNAPSTNRQQ